jgi:hypothetical protein
MNEYLLSFCPTITLPQSLILISKYFGFLLRPLQSAPGTQYGELDFVGSTCSRAADPNARTARHSAESHFRHVHVEMPILDKDQFLGLYDHHARAGLSVDCD